MGRLTLAVTGAGGFLGAEIGRRALARGHAVRALHRGPAPDLAGAEPLRADLADPKADLAPLFAGADAVVHAAGALAGGEARLARDTLAATRRLVAAAAAAGVARLVLVSSLAVYAAGPPGGTIDEASPLEPRPRLRDAYCRAKLAQEEAARPFGGALWLLRPGALYGPGRLWNAHLGPRLGPLLLCAGAGPIPLAWVGHAAQACVLAAETPGGGTINVVDDDLPEARRFLAALGAEAPRLALPVPWRGLDLLAGLLGWGGAWAPGLLRRPTLRARLMPRRYANAALRERLGWRPELSFEAAMAAARSAARSAP